MEPIRVLHVLYVMNYAGTETLLMNIYRNTDRSRIQFDFAVCSDQSGDYDKEIVDLGGRIIKYPKYTVTNHLSYRKWWEGFFRNHKEYRIVHGHIGSTAALYLSVAKNVLITLTVSIESVLTLIISDIVNKKVIEKIHEII